jgi:hypothetical protein
MSSLARMQGQEQVMSCSQLGIRHHPDDVEKWREAIKAES